MATAYIEDYEALAHDELDTNPDPRDEPGTDKPGNSSANVLAFMRGEDGQKVHSHLENKGIVAAKEHKSG